MKRWEDRAAEPLPTELLNDLWVALTGEDLGARPESPQFWWNKALDRVRELRARDDDYPALFEKWSAAEAVYAAVRRHSHQGANVIAYQGHDVERQPCPLCLALIAAGVLTEDEVGVQSRGQQDARSTQ